MHIRSCAFPPPFPTFYDIYTLTGEYGSLSCQTDSYRPKPQSVASDRKSGSFVFLFCYLLCAYPFQKRISDKSPMANEVHWACCVFRPHGTWARYRSGKGSCLGFRTRLVESPSPYFTILRVLKGSDNWTYRALLIWWSLPNIQSIRKDVI